MVTVLCYGTRTNRYEAGGEAMVRSAPQEKLFSDVLATFANTPDKRLREITNALLRHMHEFVSEVGLTQDEWMTAIKFLTAVGQASTDTRQEFILLSDILGVSSLVEMLNYRGLSGSTENTVMGPFYIPGSPRREVGDSIIETEDDGTRLLVSGVVRSLKGQPIEG